MINITHEIVDNCTIVNIDGDIACPDDVTIKEFIGGLIEKGSTEIVVDLSNVDFIDSSGISSLLKVARDVRSKGGDLRLAAIRDIVENIFIQVGLNRVLKNFPTVGDGVKSFSIN